MRAGRLTATNAGVSRPARGGLPRPPPLTHPPSTAFPCSPHPALSVRITLCPGSAAVCRCGSPSVGAGRPAQALAAPALCRALPPSVPCTPVCRALPPSVARLNPRPVLLGCRSCRRGETTRLSARLTPTLRTIRRGGSRPQSRVRKRRGKRRGKGFGKRAGEECTSVEPQHANLERQPTGPERESLGAIQSA